MLPHRADIFRNGVHRPRHGTEQLNQPGARQDHHHDEQDQHDHDLGADGAEHRNEQVPHQPADQAGAPLLGPLRVKRFQMVPVRPIPLGERRRAENINGSTEQDDDGNHHPHLEPHIAARALQRRDDGYVKKKNRPQNGTVPEKPQHHIVHPEPDVIAADQDQARRQHRYREHHDRRSLVDAVQFFRAARLFPRRALLRVGGPGSSVGGAFPRLFCRGPAADRSLIGHSLILLVLYFPGCGPKYNGSAPPIRIPARKAAQRPLSPAKNRRRCRAR